MKVSYRDLATEFSLTASELQILSDSRMALNNLGQRTGLEGFRRLGMTLIQTIQHGTPLNRRVAHVVRRNAAGGADRVRGVGGPFADHADPANDPFHSALRVHDRRRSGGHSDHACAELNPAAILKDSGRGIGLTLVEVLGFNFGLKPRPKRSMISRRTKLIRG